MKGRYGFGYKTRFPFFLSALMALAVMTGVPLRAQNLTFSGILDSTVSMKAGAAGAPAFSLGFEEYANLRAQAKLKDKAVIYGAINLIAASGETAVNTAALNAYQSGNRPGLSPSAFSSGDYYIAGIELERLYFRLNGEYLDFDGGLLRLPFGYSQIWGPLDFLNPKNPLLPDARPRAVMGAGLSWYATDALKFLGFGAGPRNPFASGDEGGLFGLSMDRHWEQASLQALYAFETPRQRSGQGLHRFGMSVKADIEVGVTAEMLYALNPETQTAGQGLSFSLGADYSFFDGNLIILAEYLYNGEHSSTALDPSGNLTGLSNRNYLYTGFTFIINDYTKTGLGLISSLDDLSFMPVITAEHELFQGCILIFTGQIPLDRDQFADNGEYGEMGPHTQRSYFNFNAKCRLRI